jgi:KRAB domain-containing zinc finger protein
LENDEEEEHEETYEVLQEDFLIESEEVDESRELAEITLEIENSMAAEETSCRFIPSADNPKKVHCKSCTNCTLENTINYEISSRPITIVCECNKAFKNRRSFTKHYSTIHDRKELNFVCRVCTEVFNSVRTRAVHEAKVHSYGFKYNCESCEKKFYRSDHLKEHMKNCLRVYDISSKILTCEVCLMKFQREETYRKHLESAHGAAGTEKLLKVLKTYPGRRSIQETSNDSGIICEQCRKTFKNEICLQRHIATMHTDQTFSCEQCDAVFVHRSTKISHMSKVHGARRPFECSFDGCSFTCLKRDRFKAHVEKHENPHKKFPCPLCQQEFNSYNTMTLHRAKHQVRDTLECPTCSRQFLDKRNFQLHLKLHTGENLFHCMICKKGFNRKDHLKKHLDRKHPEDLESKLNEKK